MGNGDGTFAPLSPIAPLVAFYACLTSADFNGDGNKDVALPVIFSSTADILLGNGDGSFQNPTEILLPAMAISIAAGDLNGDGMPDLVLVTLATQNSPQEQVVVLVNTTGQ